ncbi:MAG: hypothetical protein ACTSPM_14605 [Candidatus Heimdallarchaeota archaeon]
MSKKSKSKSKSKSKDKDDTMAIGIDLGTSLTKLVGPDGKKEVKIPSLVGDPNPGWKGLGTDKSWINNLVLTTDAGKKYFVGELANNCYSSSFIEFRGKRLC